MGIISKFPFGKYSIKLVCSISEETGLELERKQRGRYGWVWREKKEGKSDKLYHELYIN